MLIFRNLALFFGNGPRNSISAQMFFDSREFSEPNVIFLIQRRILPKSYDYQGPASPTKLF